MKFNLAWISLISICVIWAGTSQAQDNASNSQEKTIKYTPGSGIRGALLGATIHPGLRFGIERPYKYTQFDKFKVNKAKTFYKERYLSHSIGMYHHPNFHTNYFFQTEWVARRQKSRGFFYESALGVGLSRTFVDGATFTVSDDGEVTNEPFSGNWYGLVSVGGSIGYNAKMKQGKPYSIYFKNQLLFFFPHNTLLNLRPTIEFGLNYNISGFWEGAPKYGSSIKQSKRFRNSLK